MEPGLDADTVEKGTLRPAEVDRLIAEASNVQLTQAVRRTQLIRLALRGVTAHRAAKILGCSPSTVLATYKDPQFRQACMARLSNAFQEIDEQIAKEKRTLHERLAEKSEEAFEKLCDMLDSDSTPVHLRAKIAMDFLDRNPETQPGHTVRTERFDPEQLAAAARTAAEMDNVIEFKRKGA